MDMGEDLRSLFRKRNLQQHPSSCSMKGGCRELARAQRLIQRLMQESQRRPEPIRAGGVDATDLGWTQDLEWGFGVPRCPACLLDKAFLPFDSAPLVLI